MPNSRLQRALAYLQASPSHDKCVAGHDPAKPGISLALSQTCVTSCILAVLVLAEHRQHHMRLHGISGVMLPVF